MNGPSSQTAKMPGEETEPRRPPDRLGIESSMKPPDGSSHFGEAFARSPMSLGPTARGGMAMGMPGPPVPGRKEKFYELFWRNKHTTVTLCFVFWSFGMCVAFLGPTLLDLGCKTSTVFATMSWVFFSQSLFVLLGSACGGVLLQRLSPNMILLLGTTMMATTMALIPVCNQLWLLAFILAVMGFFMGIIDTVANVCMIRVYGKDVSPFLQALHFFYGMGAFVSPMIAQPFLLNEDCSPFLDNKSVSVDLFEDNDTLPASTLEDAQKITHVNYAFWIMAMLMVPVVFLSLSLFCRQLWNSRNDSDMNQNKPSQYESMDSDTSALEGKADSSPRATTFQVILISLLSAALLFLYDGLQAAYGGYIYSYAVKGPVHWHRPHAAFLNALFWGMFATGRLISIVLATKLTPAFMLFCNIAGCTTGLVLMLCMSANSHVLIVGTCMLGVFMSSVFPSALSLTEQYIHVNPTITSSLVFGASLGEMIMPVVVGHEFDRQGPITFLIAGVVLCFLSVIVYIMLVVAGHSVVRSSASQGITQFLSTLVPKTEPTNGEDTSLMTKHVRYYSRMRSDMSESSIGEQYGDTSFVEMDEPPKEK